MIKKLFKMITLSIIFVIQNVYAEEYINNYIDIEEPLEAVEEFEKYTNSVKHNDFHLETNASGEVTMSSITDSKYSSVDEGYVTSVKNQMSTGSCWAHAGMSILETAAIKSGVATTDLNLSEMHVVYGTNASAFSDTEIKNRFYLGGPLNSTNNGGNIIMTASYLYSGLGAIKDSLFPLKSYSSYKAGEVKPIGSNGKEVQITTSEFATIDSTPEFYVDDFYSSYGTRGSCSKSINDIKRMILNYGSVQVSVYWKDTNVHNSYYFVNSSSNSTNHAVTVVGWDDTIEASKFGFDDETKTGGWIMKNSWGTSKGDHGYYYISYYDKTVCGTVSTFNGVDTNVYDHVYDSTGMYYSSALYNVTSKDVYQASVFDNKGENESLEKVSFAVNPGYSYTVYYAPYNDGTWKSQSSSWITLGSLNSSDVSYYGIKSLNVKSANVKITGKYVIILKSTKPNGSANNLAVVTYKDSHFVKDTISTLKMELIEDTNYYSVDASLWNDLYNYHYVFNYQCDSDSDGEKDDTCTYDSHEDTDGAQNVIYAYTKEEVQKNKSIDSSVINSNNQTIVSFYSFDDSKFKIDISSVNSNIENYYSMITNTDNEDFTSHFNIDVDNSNHQILISTANDSYIPAGTYNYTLYYDLDNSGKYEYTIISTLVVSKPFTIDKINVSTSDSKIYEDTSFTVKLKNYANTLTTSVLSYNISKNNSNVTNKFNIHYSSGSVSIEPKVKVDVGVYTFSISIDDNDTESIQFEVIESIKINYTPVENEFVITPNNTTHTYTKEELNNNVSSRYGVTILNSKGETINPSLIGTGMKIKINISETESTTYTFVIIGDLSGDGKVTTADYVRLWNHLDRSNSFNITDEAILKAADISGDNKLSTSDYIKLWNLLKRG